MRPSKNTDQQLILAARELLLEKRSLSIGLREVASRAGVNMGMFYYHFKDKEDFWLKVLQEFYEEFFLDLKIDSNASESALENLRSSVAYISKFFIKNRELFIALFCSAVNGDEVTNQFLKKNFLRHIRILLNLIKKSQRQGDLCALPPFTILTMLMGGTNIPTFAFLAFMKGPLGGTKLRSIGATKESIMSDESIDERIEILISALRKKDKK